MGITSAATAQGQQEAELLAHYAEYQVRVGCTHIFEPAILRPHSEQTPEAMALMVRVCW